MNQPLVGIIMGSDSDLPTMQGAIAACEEFGVPCEVAIVSAHRTPKGWWIMQNRPTFGD